MRSLLPAADQREAPAAVSLAHDERGAVMVLGIFMCTVLVGALWYLAGIGDAIVYRERLQEASDAGALSDAVLHARGMNLIVLINLIMACVLAIRVALKVIQLTLVFAAVIFGGLALIPGPQMALFSSLSTLCANTATTTQNVINSTRDPINNTLKGLHKAQTAVARATPGASLAASVLVLNKYKPFITVGFSSPDHRKLGGGLPVVNGTTDRLCGKAAEAMVEIIDDVLPISLGPGKGTFKGLMAKIVSKGTGYFCELGGSNTPPDLGDITDDTAKDRCGSEYKKKQSDLDEASKAWHAECEAAKVVCFDKDPNYPDRSMMSGLGALEKSTKVEDNATAARLKKLQQDRDAADDALKGFDQPKCVDEQKKELNKQLKDVPPAQATNSQGMEPMKVDPKWFNGSADGQMLAFVKSDDEFLRPSPKGVKVGAMKDKVTAMKIDVPLGGDFAYSQSEFFYDCAGVWASDKCNSGNSTYNNDDQEAMWHLRWRGRLRRYNNPFPAVDVILSPFLRGRSLALGVDVFSKNLSGDIENMSRRKELVETQAIESYELH